MTSSIKTLSILELSGCLVLIGIVLAIYAYWSKNDWTILHASARMVLQLVAVGFLLNLVFANDHPLLISCLLFMMMFIASFIALRPVKDKRQQYLMSSFISITIGGGFSLLIVIFWIVRPDDWHNPRILLPLAGMIFANAMNSVSLAIERYLSEKKHGMNTEEARSKAYITSLIPILNAFFAVGLVSLPGMMTGQILSGVSPLVAVRYQIMVMSMVLGSAGISSALMLWQLSKTDRSS